MPVNLKSGFALIRDSDLTYEKMTVEIQYKGEQIAQINMDKGLDNLEMEIFTEFIGSNYKPKFLLGDFLEAVNEAKRIIKEYDK